VEANITFSPKQYDLIFRAKASYIVASGPTRTGKTLATLMRWYRYLYSDEVPEGVELLMSGRTLGSLYSNCLRELLKFDGDFNDMEWRSHKSMLYVKSKRLEIRCVGCDDINAKEKIKGMTAWGWYCDEATAHLEDFFDMASSRATPIGNAGRRLKIFTTNPDHPSHWFKTRVIDSANLDVKNYFFEFDDNPALSREAIEELKRTHVGVFFDRMIRGLWTVAEGAIYDQFDKRKLLVMADQMPWKTIQRYIIGADWGYAEGHALALVLIAVDASGTLYVIDEFVKERQLVDKSLIDQLQMKGWFELKQWYWDGLAWKSWNVKPDVAYCDPARPEYLRIFRDLTGISTVGAIKKSKVELIQSVQRRIVPDPQGRYGIYFLEGKAPVSVSEFEGYRWQPGTQEPIKEKDNSQDAIQYASSMVERGAVKFVKK
jgi:PBSX family phage terminase large subunit